MSVTVNKQQAQKIAYGFIYDKLGSNLEPGEPFLGDMTLDDKIVQIWIIPILADYPRAFEDMRTGGMRYIIMQLGKVGEIEIDAETGEEVTLPHRYSIEHAILAELEKIRNNVEKILIRTASSQFAKLITLRHMLAPLQVLLTNLLERRLLNYSELEAGGVNPRYVQLLERTNFIKRDDSSNGVFPSGELSELYRRFAQDLGHGEALTKSLETVIGEVLNTHYRYIYDELKLRQLAPYVHIASSYYNSALSVNDLISIRETDLEEAYQKIYGLTNSRKMFRFPDYLRQLSAPNVEIMEPVSENVWKGNENIFKDMLRNNPISPTTPR